MRNAEHLKFHQGICHWVVNCVFPFASHIFLLSLVVHGGEGNSNKHTLLLNDSKMLDKNFRKLCYAEYIFRSQVFIGSLLSFWSLLLQKCTWSYKRKLLHVLSEKFETFWGPPASSWLRMPALQTKSCHLIVMIIISL